MKTRKEFRIVTDNFCGCEVQIKRRWWPFWVQCRKNGPINTFSSIDKAKSWVEAGRPRKSKFKPEEIVYL